MKRKFVICIDGSCRTPINNNNFFSSFLFVVPDVIQRCLLPKFSGIEKRKSIVQSIFDNIQSKENSETPIIKKYFPGCASEGGFRFYHDFLSGWKIAVQLSEVLQFIGTNYQRNDEFYFFGYSRGSFVILLVIMFLKHFQIPEKLSNWNNVDLKYLVEFLMKISSSKRNISDEFKSKEFQDHCRSLSLREEGSTPLKIMFVSLIDTCSRYPSIIEEYKFKDFSEDIFQNCERVLHCTSYTQTYCCCVNVLPTSFWRSSPKNEEEERFFSISQKSLQIIFNKNHREMGDLTYSDIINKNSPLHFMIDEAKEKDLIITVPTVESSTPYTNQNGIFTQFFRGLFGLFSISPSFNFIEKDPIKYRNVRITQELRSNLKNSKKSLKVVENSRNLEDIIINSDEDEENDDDRSSILSDFEERKKRMQQKRESKLSSITYYRFSDEFGDMFDESNPYTTSSPTSSSRSTSINSSTSNSRTDESSTPSSMYDDSESSTYVDLTSDNTSEDVSSSSAPEFTLDFSSEEEDDERRIEPMMSSYQSNTYQGRGDDEV